MKQLTQNMMRCAELAVAHPDWTYYKLAEETGAGYSTVYKWFHNPRFQEYLHSLCMERFKSSEKLAIEKLIENVNKGNQKAIEYLLNYVGYQAPEKIEVSGDRININITGDEHAD